MKRMRFCLNSLFAVILIACLLGVSPQPALAYGRVFTVSPTGGDDTSNIQQAFAHAQASGPGATVQFTAGTFITDLITVVNFKGNVKGMGQDKTIITARPNLSCQAAIDQGFLPSLFRFSEGSIQMSDLTLKIANPDPCASYTFSWWGSDYTTWLYGGLTFAGPAPVNMTQCGFYKRGKIEATIDRVSVLVGDGVTLVAGIVGGGDYVTQNSCSGYGYNTETRLQITHSFLRTHLIISMCKTSMAAAW